MVPEGIQAALLVGSVCVKEVEEVSEFRKALLRKRTYDPRRNSYVSVGFLWGAGVPLLWLLLWFFGTSQEPLATRIIVGNNDYFWIACILSFLPLIFAIIFGAHGTTRHDQSKLINRTFNLLDDEVERRTKELSVICSETVLALSQAIEAKDPYTRGHCFRVWKYAERAAIGLELPNRDIDDLRFACYLHDVGKIKVPGKILNKDSDLSESERAIVRIHPAYGAQIVSHIHSLKRVAELILCHHERCDGSGYPAGIEDSKIPRLAKILAVADTLDAMTSSRSYRKGLSIQVAIEEIRRCAGLSFDAELIQGGDRSPRHLFDPKIVECMVEGLESVVVFEEAQDFASSWIESKLQQMQEESSNFDSSVLEARSGEQLDRRENCWEVRDCGRTERGKDGTPPCAVVLARHANGVNSGVNGGRVCWSIVGSLCSDRKVASDLSGEQSNCTTCGFFQQVWDEEGIAEFSLFSDSVREGILRES